MKKPACTSAAAEPYEGFPSLEIELISQQLPQPPTEATAETNTRYEKLTVMSDMYVWFKGILLPALSFKLEHLREEHTGWGIPRGSNLCPFGTAHPGSRRMGNDYIDFLSSHFSLMVICLIRNPRDSLVPGYFFYRILNFIKKPESLEQFFEWFIQGNEQQDTGWAHSEQANAPSTGWMNGGASALQRSNQL
ncbi:hypothetical protein HPG69_018286 [Diceros bicornis minor]|uniref:Sulfotransferase n=1 Tax=Diceros bicornis minor TaxID=77932 RepID=A0A7J7ERT3_DICBM|nr:hypothetical protein HPG69_018286 [Diceros bicornis minor]